MIRPQSDRRGLWSAGDREQTGMARGLLRTSSPTCFRVYCGFLRFKGWLEVLVSCFGVQNMIYQHLVFHIQGFRLGSGVQGGKTYRNPGRFNDRT